MAPNLVKPKRLKAGDTVGIVAPSSPMFEESRMEFVFKWLAKLGLKYKLGINAFNHYGDLAGTEEERIFDLHSMFSDSEVDAIIALRGGTGSVGLLDKLDFDLIKSNPKIFIGFSDITGLLIPIHQITGLVTFHGPSAGSFFESAYTFENFKRALFEPYAIGRVNPPSDGDEFNPTNPPYAMALANGAAEGPLVGGCLTLIKQLMGTPYEIDTDEKLLFFEDVGEEPHNIDLMVTQLKLAGKLDKVNGIIVGECVECIPGKSKRARMDLNYSVLSMLKENICDLDIPVLYGPRFGHSKLKLTLPIGVNAKLKVEDGNTEFTILEECTSS